MALDPLWGNIFKQRSAGRDAVVEVLKNVPLFEELTDRELLRVERIVHKRRYGAGEAIVRENEPGAGMYIIRTGKVDIRQATRNGAHRHLAALGAGDFFGEMALLDEDTRAATAVATEDCDVLGFFKPDLFDLVKRDPQLGLKIVMGVARMLSLRLRYTNKQLIEIQGSAAGAGEAAGNEQGEVHP